MNQKTSLLRAGGLPIGLTLLVLLSPVLAQAGAKKKASGRNINLVWPLPPEKPRIKFLQAIYGATDVEPAKKANFFDRLAGIQKKGFKPTLLKPYDVATDSRNRIYVTDSGQGLVFVFDLDNKQVSYLGRDGQVRLHVPLGVTVDAKDRVWVADATGQHVYAFDGEGNVLMGVGKQDEMVNPTSVAVDEGRRRLYVVDSKQHCILVYDPDSGQFITKFGQRGTEQGQFNFPTNVALDRAGRIFVTDTMNCRVQIFDPDYRFVDTFGQQGNKFGQFLKPKGLAFDARQNLYVVDSDFDNFQIFDQKKRLLMFLGGGGQLPGRFWLPAGIHIDRTDKIYVADQNNRRIQIFQLLDGATMEQRVSPAEIATASTTPKKGGETGVTKPADSEASSKEIK